MKLIGQILIGSVLASWFMSPAIRVSRARSGLGSTTQTAVSLAPFSSVELRNGGKAFVHFGPTQRVTLLKGSVDYTNVAIADGDRLVVDKCPGKCPRGYELEIEIVTPDINRISVMHGGTIQSRGDFTRQEKTRLAVSNGGTIDIRSMTVNSVTASVDQGGRILTKPQTAMIASVSNGGNITYWGDAQVVQSIKRGGVITKGSADEADKPLSEFDPALPSVPSLPKLASQPVRNLRR